MRKSVDSVRSLVLDALAACTGADRGALNGSTRLLDLDVDSLTLAAILSLTEAADDSPLDSERVQRALRAHDVDALVAAMLGLSPSTSS